MAFLVSRCVGLVTPEPGAAADYYQAHFDMEVSTADAGIELRAGPLRVFLDPGQPRSLVLELLTDDILEARSLLRTFGFEELVWRGPGQSCLVRDPFGLVVNIHEDRSAFYEFTLTERETGMFKPCIGAQTPLAEEAAEFYGRVLDTPYGRAPDGSFVVDSGPMRFRFRMGPVTIPIVWLRPNTAVDRFIVAGCTDCNNGVFIDRYGLHWCIESAIATPTAVVCPL